LLLEVGQAQAEKVSELIEKRGEFLAPERLQDLSGIERVVKAQRKTINSKHETRNSTQIRMTKAQNTKWEKK
jgi:hypothetical protein